MEITRRLPQPVIQGQVNQELGADQQAGLKAGDVELKKLTELAKRFGNEELKTHSQLKNVKGALQTLQPEQLVKLLESTIKSVNGNSSRTRLDKQEIPELKPPVSRKSGAEETKYSNSAWATALLGKIMQLTTETSISNLSGQIQSINAMMNGAVGTYSEVATQLEQQGIQWAQDSDAAKAAQQQAEKLAQNVAKGQTTLNEAQNTLNALEAEAAKQNPVSEELQNKIEAAKAELVDAKEKLAQAKAVYNNFVNDKLTPALNAEKNSLSALQTVQANAQKLVGSFNLPQQELIEKRRQESERDSKSLTFLLALMAQLINKSSSEELKATAELKQKLSEAAAKDAEKKAHDYEEQVRKAEEMQKTMGCIGKAIGWLITIGSVVAAAFTGGASLALAAVGLALALGDEISQAVTGHSFMADMMQPIMSSIIQPLMEELGAIFSSILQAAGVDKEKAGMIGNILGVAAVAVLLTVGMMAVKAGMNKVLDKLIGKVGTMVAKQAAKTAAKKAALEAQKQLTKNAIQNITRTAIKESTKQAAEQASKTTMQKLMDNAVVQIIKRVSRGFGRSLGTSEVKMAKVSNYTQKAVTAADFFNTTTKSTVDIIAANMQLEAAKCRADMIRDAALQDLLNEMMNRAIDSFSSRMEMLNEIIRNISVVTENQTQAGKYILKQMKSMAG